MSVQDEIILKLQKELEAAKESKLSTQESHLRKRLSKLREAMLDLEEQVNMGNEGLVYTNVYLYVTNYYKNNLMVCIRILQVIGTITPKIKTQKLLVLECNHSTH